MLSFTPADIQDRDGGVFVMATMFGMYPFLMKLYADGGYQGPLFRRAVAKIKSGGSSNELSHGSAGAGVSPKIGRISTERRSHFCASLQSGSCSENYAIPHDLSGQTLSINRAASSGCPG